MKEGNGLEIINRSQKLIYAIIFILVLFFVEIYSYENRQTVIELKALKVTSPLVIDGVLDEEVWKSTASVDDVFITYNPNDGDMFPKRTKVWVAYDSENLYFAFYCYDSEPKKIKTSITKRDNMFSDDWIGLGIDTLGNRQSLYELFVNPSGMQGDLYNTPSSGENGAPDWVWYSGGKIVKDGFTVEIKLPLNSIRYKSGEDVSVNVLFWRRCSRLGVSGAWPEIDPGKGLFNSLGKIVYGKLDKQMKLEFIPSLTYGSIWDRESPESWSEADDRGEFGISAKIGLSSTTTLDFTVNPDFSQVESDTFQVTHNLRYPIFYSEKRPFFMEAGDMFSLSGTSNNMYSAVHTRKIVDPEWGTRITGSSGKLSYGGLVASDSWAGRVIEDEDNFYLGKKSLYTIGRMKYGIGGDNYIGILYSGKELGDFHNRVFAIDSTL
ncbi:MAG: carbohydrate binding family 9 domain-containing protein, partial [Candidatus Aminicenantes bacterium]|nr:carbohydrate binding family 9 domain-containing protein [Candidatus Aminicenantes bacterium]